jgi:hypothetical protein
LIFINNQFIVDLKNGTSQYNAFGFYMNANSVSFSGASYDASFPNGTTNPYQWYHAALVFEADNVKIYINGVTGVV